MKIGKKESSILLYLFGVGLAVAALFYGNSLVGQTDTLKAENDILSQEVAYLQDLYDHQQEYQEESDRMNLEMEEIKEQFPAEIREENQIMYANGLESKYDVLLEAIEMPGTELVTVEGDFSVQTSPATTTTDATAEDAEATADATADATAVADTSATISTAATSISLYRALTTFEYQSSYKGIKDMVRTINEDTDRKSIESLTVGYNSQTGNLTGSLEFSMYALSGTEKEYEAPVVTGVTDGVQQIFSGATTLNRSGSASNETGDASTADGKTNTTNSNE